MAALNADAVIAAAAAHVEADVIVTRNKKDFAQATVPAYTPDELLAMLEAG